MNHYLYSFASARTSGRTHVSGRCTTSFPAPASRTPPHEPAPLTSSPERLHPASAHIGPHRLDPAVLPRLHPGESSFPPPPLLTRMHRTSSGGGWLSQHPKEGREVADAQSVPKGERDTMQHPIYF